MQPGPEISAEKPKGNFRTRRQVLGQGCGWLSEPRTAVLVVVGGVLLVGGGRRLFQVWQARKGLARLTEPDVRPEEIEAAARFGRASLTELFRLLTESPAPAHRHAAGRAISVLWAGNELVAEEEQALARRGYTVEWTARRRYPRALRGEIPIAVTYGLSFLTDGGPGIKPANLEWSHCVKGARRAALEEYSPWTTGPGRLTFSVIPGDFDTNGPHRLVLQSRVRTCNLADLWQIDLPHLPFNFEFDPRLEVSALLTLPDEPRGEVIARSIWLENQEMGDAGTARFLHLNSKFTIRNPPRLTVATPLPCDLAHQAFLEIEGVPGRFAAGSIVVSSQGIVRGDSSLVPSGSRTLPIGPVQAVPKEAIGRPGSRRVRLVLEADPDLGWTDPEVRSIWPGTIEAEWVSVEIVRR
ncbi:MAG: hypothetical protein ACP5XB_19630 [Isosphaeraceae bacterium]